MAELDREFHPNINISVERVVLTYTEPLRVPKETRDSDLDAVTAELRRRLLAVEQDASARLEREPVP